MYRKACFINIRPGFARMVTPFASWRLESISSPIDVATIPTSGRSNPCRQQRIAAVSQNLVWTHLLKSINPLLRRAKNGSRASRCQLQLAVFYPGKPAGS